MSISPILEKLYLTRAIQENPLKIDSLFLSFSPDLLSSLAKDFKPLIESLYFDFIYPTETFSIPLATHLSLIYNVPLFLSPQMNTFMHPGQTALLFDASSSFSPRLQAAASELKKRGIFVSDALILLNPTPEEEENEITLHSLWDITAMQNDLNTLLHQNSYSKIHSSDIS